MDDEAQGIVEVRGEGGQRVQRRRRGPAADPREPGGRGRRQRPPLPHRRAAGHHRRSHRALQPPLLLRPPAPGVRARAALRPAAVAAHARHRRLQAVQRHATATRSATRCSSEVGTACSRGSCGAASTSPPATAARSSWCCCPTPPRRRARRGPSGWCVEVAALWLPAWTSRRRHVRAVRAASASASGGASPRWRLPGSSAGGPRVTVSVGLAAYPELGDQPGPLVRNADKALYLAKRAARTVWRCSAAERRDDGHAPRPVQDRPRGRRHADRDPRPRRGVRHDRPPGRRGARRAVVRHQRVRPGRRHHDLRRRVGRQLRQEDLDYIGHGDRRPATSVRHDGEVLARGGDLLIEPTSTTPISMRRNVPSWRSTTNAARLELPLVYARRGHRRARRRRLAAAAAGSARRSKQLLQPLASLRPSRSATRARIVLSASRRGSAAPCSTPSRAIAAPRPRGRGPQPRRAAGGRGGAGVAERHLRVRAASDDIVYRSVCVPSGSLQTKADDPIGTAYPLADRPGERGILATGTIVEERISDSDLPEDRRTSMERDLGRAAF